MSVNENPSPTAAEPGPAEVVARAIAALHEVFDPETGINVWDLGLIYGLHFDPTNGVLKVRMTFTTRACPLRQSMTQGVERRLIQLDEVDAVDVEETFEPPWTPEAITPEGRAALGWR